MYLVEIHIIVIVKTYSITPKVAGLDWYETEMSLYPTIMAKYSLCPGLTIPLIPLRADHVSEDLLSTHRATTWLSTQGIEGTLKLFRVVSKAQIHTVHAETHK